MSPEAVQSLLLARGETVCCAESLTGGSLAALFSQTAGASAVFLGGVVSYATEIKRSVLGVTAPQVISAECAIQMATGVQQLLGADWAVSTTGVAGPDSQEGEPVGTVFIGVVGPRTARSLRLALSGTREQIRADTCQAALSALETHLR